MDLNAYTHYILNYLYSLLFAEVRLAILQKSLDPEAGIFHADELYRGSFVYNVMEAARSDVDGWFLDFAHRTQFSKKWFQEKADGVVRCNQYITPRLAGTLPTWRQQAGPLLAGVQAILGGAWSLQD